MDALDAQRLEEFGGVQFLLRVPIEAGLETGLETVENILEIIETVNS